MSLPERSFYGGVFILAVLVIRGLLLHRLPKRTFVILWGAALLRLLLPFAFSSKFSIYALLGDGIRAGNSWAGVWRLWAKEIGAADYLSLSTSALSSGKEIPFVSGGSQFSILWLVWCMGAGFCTILFMVIYLRCLREFHMALPMENDFVEEWLRRHKGWHFVSVRQSDKIAAPLTYGVFRPVILLPKRLLSEETNKMEYVLQHEYVHICCGDTVVKLAMIAALCIHWYNPLVWFMAAMLNRDIELACDEGVLRRFGERARSEYALTLIGMQEKTGRKPYFYNGFSKNSMEERIKAIMKYKKITWLTFLSAILLIGSVTVVFAADVQETAGVNETVRKPSAAKETTFRPAGTGDPGGNSGGVDKGAETAGVDEAVREPSAAKETPFRPAGTGDPTGNSGGVDKGAETAGVDETVREPSAAKETTFRPAGTGDPGGNSGGVDKGAGTAGVDEAVGELSENEAVFRPAGTGDPGGNSAETDRFSEEEQRNIVRMRREKIL